MKSHGMGKPAKLRLAAAVVCAALLLLYSPAMAYDFEPVEVGQSGSIGVEIENLSTTSQLTFNLSLASGGSAGFSLPVAEVSIPAGETALAEVVFSPPAEGTFVDTLNVYYSTFLIQEISLNGTGVAKTASEEPDTQASEDDWPRWFSPVASLEYNGKTIGEHVQECIESAKNHGQAVRCVAFLAADLRKEHVISRHDAKHMRHLAAKSKHHKHTHKAKKHGSKWESRLEKKAYVR